MLGHRLERGTFCHIDLLLSARTAMFSSSVGLIEWELDRDSAWQNDVRVVSTLCKRLICLCFRLGRKKAVLGALVVEFIVCIAQVFIPIYELYAVARFLVGTSTGGSFTGIFVMCTYSKLCRHKFTVTTVSDPWFTVGGGANLLRGMPTPDETTFWKFFMTKWKIWHR